MSITLMNVTWFLSYNGLKFESCVDNLFMENQMVPTVLAY